MRAILALVCVTACAPQQVRGPAPQPPEEIRAVQLYMAGADSLEVAAKLAMDHATAQAVLRHAIAELNRKFYREH